MKLVKKTCSIISKIILAILINLVFVVSQTNAQEANLHIKLEVSLDGNTWYNYSGSEDPEGEILHCSPGTNVIVKITLWNSGDADATNVGGGGTITNASYIENVSDVEPDADGNGRDFIGYYFIGDADGLISQIDQGGSYDVNEESMTAVLTLEDDFPVGQTTITATASIDYEGEVLMGSDDGDNRDGQIPEINNQEDLNIISFLKNFLLQKAYAQQGLGRYSRVRIVVNSELPATGADLR